MRDGAVLLKKLQKEEIDKATEKEHPFALDKKSKRFTG